MEKKDLALYLLINRPRYITYEMIAANTPLTVHWLKLFHKNGIKKPKEKRLDDLITFLNLKSKNV